MSRPHFLADNDLNDAIVMGVLRREPTIEFARLRDLGLATRADPARNPVSVHPFARVIRCRFIFSRVIRRVIRCRFIFSGKNDGLTPDFDTGFPRISPTPDFPHPQCIDPIIAALQRSKQECQRPVTQVLRHSTYVRSN